MVLWGLDGAGSNDQEQQQDLDCKQAIAAVAAKLLVFLMDAAVDLSLCDKVEKREQEGADL